MVPEMDANDSELFELCRCRPGMPMNPLGFAVEADVYMRRESEAHRGGGRDSGGGTRLGDGAMELKLAADV